jgi:hypothetical protein
LVKMDLPENIETRLFINGEVVLLFPAPQARADTL